MKFRHHRELFEDSMATCVEVNSMEELVAEINKTHPTYPLGEITFSHSGHDARCNWNTWIVCSDNKAIGMSDSGGFASDLRPHLTICPHCQSKLKFIRADRTMMASDTYMCTSVSCGYRYLGGDPPALPISTIEVKLMEDVKMLRGVLTPVQWILDELVEFGATNLPEWMFEDTDDEDGTIDPAFMTRATVTLERLKKAIAGEE